MTEKRALANLYFRHPLSLKVMDIEGSVISRHLHLLANVHVAV